MVKKITSLVGSTLLVAVVPLVASAQQFSASGGDFGVFLKNVISFINTYLIPFILAIGFLVFVWGMFKYFILGGDNDDARKEGKNLIIYALAGFVLIFIFWGLVIFVANSTGFAGQNAPVKLIPKAPTI